MLSFPRQLAFLGTERIGQIANDMLRPFPALVTSGHMGSILVHNLL